MTIQNKFALWLHDSLSESGDKKYRHRLFSERPHKRDEIFGELTSYVQNAHEDARKRLRKLVENTLDPFGPSSSFDPAKGYPELFHMQTLKGYFGEVFAGLIAEHFSPFNEDGWKVPAFLFRYHSVEFQQLEILRQKGGKAKLRPGRTGDDCLAFQLDEESKILRVLYCEAKCTPAHRPGMIAEAHKKASESVLVDLPQIIEILQQREDPVSRQWLSAIQHLWINITNCKFERCDMVSYICGIDPVKENRSAWLSTDNPHEKYKAQRRLEAVEIHLPNVEELIRKVYEKRDDIVANVSIASAAED